MNISLYLFQVEFDFFTKKKCHEEFMKKLTNLTSVLNHPKLELIYSLK